MSKTKTFLRRTHESIENPAPGGGGNRLFSFLLHAGPGPPWPLSADRVRVISVGVMWGGIQDGACAEPNETYRFVASHLIIARASRSLLSH